jgi:Flp pilus assembly protein CpaB
MVPGISDQLLVIIMILAAAAGMFAYVAQGVWRLDARIRRDRERAAAELRPEK